MTMADENPARICGFCDFYKVTCENPLTGRCGLPDAVMPGNMRIPKFGSNVIVPERPCLYSLREGDDPVKSREALADILNMRSDLLLSGVKPEDVNLSRLKKYQGSNVRV